MDNSVIEKIKNEVDIVNVVSQYIDLSKKGRNYWALCPFHEDSNPSMSVSPEKQMYKCFVCGAGGGVFNFVSNYEKISFQEAVKKVGSTIGVDVEIKEWFKFTYSDSQRKIIKIMKEVNNFFKYSLNTESGKLAKEYLKTRGVSIKLIDDFNIGYAPSKGLKQYLLKKGFDESLIINAGLITENGSDFFRDRVIFAISNENKDVVAFSARDLTGKSNAKYINSPESKLFSKSNTLYNYGTIKEIARKEKEIYLNEGFMDVIAMTRAGFTNSVAIMGTALTKEHIRALREKKVIIMFDSDKAGINATIKSLKLLFENNIEVQVVKNNSNKDPDEILQSDGIEKLREIALNKISGIDFIFDLHKKMYPADSPKNIELFLNSFAKYLSYSSDIEKEFYINKVQEFLGISREIINKRMPTTETTYKKYVRKQPYIKTKTVEEKNKIERNYSYELILSILKNKTLLKIFKEKYIAKQIYFIEPVMLVISSYLIKLSEGKNERPKKVVQKKVQEILKYEQYVNSPEEFNELIERVNNQSKTKMIKKIKVKLRNKDISSQDRRMLIQHMAKLKSGK